MSDRICAGCPKRIPLMAHLRTRWCGPKCRDKAKNDNRRARKLSNRTRYHIELAATCALMLAMLVVAATAGAL